jgi:hypothetical protein
MGGVAAWAPLTTVASGSIPGLGVICELSLLLIISIASRVFLRVLRFSSLRKNQQKSTFLNYNLILDEGHKFISYYVLPS